MAKPNPTISIAISLLVLSVLAMQANALIPYTRSLWDLMLPTADGILEQAPFAIPKPMESLALARVDWKETSSEHIIMIDIPGMKKNDIKIEVEENGVLRISGERKVDENDTEGDIWHRSERSVGKFWRQFRLPANADLDSIKAHLEDGVLKITVPKFVGEKRKPNKVINIADHSSGENIKPTKAAA